MPSAWQEESGLFHLAALVLLGRRGVDAAADRGDRQRYRDRAHRAGRAPSVAGKFSRAADADERKDERPDGQDDAADVEGVHCGESYRSRERFTARRGTEAMRRWPR